MFKVKKINILSKNPNVVLLNKKVVEILGLNFGDRVKVFSSNNNQEVFEYCEILEEDCVKNCSLLEDKIGILKSFIQN